MPGGSFDSLPQFDLTNSLPELDALESTRDLIRVPDELNVPLTPRVRALVDTAAFQRLRHVSQLGLVSQVYPGATHSRFEHALGVYHNALRYLQQLRRDARFVESVDRPAAELLIVAALLHDIGHWPYCHPIEDIGLDGLTRHEEAARDIVLGDEVGGVLRTQWGLDPADVVGVLEGRRDDGRGRIIRSILSGPIDVDKMDYLERDSLHAGVPYGRNFDKQRLIQSLILAEDGRSLAITSKGRTAAELMVFARYVMFSEVYWHHAVRSATAMLTRAVLELKDRLPMGDLLAMRDGDFVSALRRAADGTECEPLTEGSVGTGRALYKRRAEFSRESDASLYDRLAALSSAELAGRSSDLAARLGLGPLELLIDVPSPRREIEFDIDVRYDKAGPGLLWRKLREASPVVDALAGSQFTDAVKLIRVFVAAGRAEAVVGVDWPAELAGL